ncbi:NitT/TauT family transport system substrate-binding protein [Rhodoligotrophos appendicifer]|uniref:ABC transporter substrate-binding protein n=1 Tax=Rhodoligotrophos appendicifer TaxID=987056 RepID=UPI001184AAB4|nr:ABC transporter substrate-binding protein [Rhodoligotrophos appendicifer]
MLKNNSRTIDRRRFLSGSAGLAATAAFVPGGIAAQASAGDLVYGIGNLDAMFTAGFVALKKGFFKEAGLNASFLDCQNGPRARQMLAAGQIDICASASFDPIIITLAGKPTKVIASIDRRLPYANVIVNRKDFESGQIKSFSDLSGKRLGVSGPKSAFWLMASHMVEKGKLEGVEIRFIGGTPEMLAALKSGQVDASMATMTMMDQAEKEGWGVPIVSINDDAGWTAAMGLGGDVPGQWIYTLAPFVEKRPDAVQAFVTGWMKGNAFVFANSPETVADLIHEEFLRSFKKDTLVRTISVLKEKVWSKDNVVSPEAYQRVLTVMGGDRMMPDADMAKLPYATEVDMAFVTKARGT